MIQVITSFKIILPPTVAYDSPGFTTRCIDGPMLGFQQWNQGFILFAIPMQAQYNSWTSTKFLANK